jgi:putative ABC transport system permease protein
VRVDFGYGGDRTDEAAREREIAAIEQGLRSTLPVADLQRAGSVICPPGTPVDQSCHIELVLNDACPQLAAWQAGVDLSDSERRAASRNPACDPRNTNGASFGYVADGSAVPALTGASGDDLRRAQEVLAAGGVVVRSPLYIADGQVTLAVTTPDAGTQVPRRGLGDGVELVKVPGYLLTTSIGPGPAVLSAEAVKAAGLDSDVSMVVATTTRMPTPAELERANAALQPLQAFPSLETGFTNEVEPILLMLLAAAVVITIGAASVGTALAAADGRADLSTLAAVGASPTVRRGLSVSQSGVIAVLGSVLGALAGVGAAVAVLAAIAQQYGEVLWPSETPPQPVVPWLTLLITLVATPAVAVLGAGLLTRSRLPIERRL